MKRYLVFVSKAYYPMGGAMDLFGDFNDLEKAKAEVIKFMILGREHEYSADIIDTKEDTVYEIFPCFGLYTLSDSEIMERTKNNKPLFRYEHHELEYQDEPCSPDEHANLVTLGKLRTDEDITVPDEILDMMLDQVDSR